MRYVCDFYVLSIYDVYKIGPFPYVIVVSARIFLVEVTLTCILNVIKLSQVIDIAPP